MHTDDFLLVLDQHEFILQTLKGRTYPDRYAVQIHLTNRNIFIITLPSQSQSHYILQKYKLSSPCSIRLLLNADQTSINKILGIHPQTLQTKGNTQFPKNKDILMLKAQRQHRVDISISGQPQEAFRTLTCRLPVLIFLQEQQDVSSFFKTYHEFSHWLQNDSPDWISDLIKTKNQQLIQRLVNKNERGDTKQSKTDKEACFQVRRIVFSGTQHGVLIMRSYRPEQASPYSQFQFVATSNRHSQHFYANQFADIKSVNLFNYLVDEPAVQIFYHSCLHKGTSPTCLHHPCSDVFVFESVQDRELVLSKYLGDKKVAFNLQKPRTVEEYTADWLEKKISNFQYLIALNTLSGRSFHIPSQYPVFPWVFHDYSSNTVDLQNKDIWRDLSTPLGALNKHRLKRNKDLKALRASSNAIDIAELHHTFYSTPYIVFYYLLRSRPMLIFQLQKTLFTVPGRVLKSIQECYFSALNAQEYIGELIPEFYSVQRNSYSFMLNLHSLDLGKDKKGASIENVQLPAGAEDPQKFVSALAAGLESSNCSENLNLWIDLVFGYKQRGSWAQKSENSYYVQSVENQIINCKEPGRLRHLKCQIKEFGVLPKQLFIEPHPRRRESQTLHTKTAPQVQKIEKPKQEFEKIENLGSDIEKIDEGDMDEKEYIQKCRDFFEDSF